MIYGPDAHFEGEAEVENETAFYGPEFIRTGLGNDVAIDGKPEVPAALGRLYILHGITPETATSTHYFGFSTRNFRLDDPQLDEFSSSLTSRSVSRMSMQSKRSKRGWTSRQPFSASCWCDGTRRL